MLTLQLIWPSSLDSSASNTAFVGKKSILNLHRFQKIMSLNSALNAVSGFVSVT